MFEAETTINDDLNHSPNGILIQPSTFYFHVYFYIPQT